VRENNETNNAAPPFLTALLKRWHQGECWTAVLCFAFIAAVIVLDVFNRELLGPLFSLLGMSAPSGLFGAQKLAVFALVIGSFAAIGIATATASHLAPKVGHGWFPKTWSRTIDRIADIITGLVFVITAWFGWQFVLVTKEYGLLAPVINTSPWMIQLAIPLGFLSAALRYFIFAIWPATRPIPPEFKE